MTLMTRSLYNVPLMSYILRQAKAMFSTICHFYWYVFDQGHQLIPQTEYASEVFLNDLMVWFLLEAPLELILTGDFKCSLLTTEGVVH